MPEKIKVKIDGKIFEAENGEYILDLARRNKIIIPSFCHHDGLSGLGCCRLCVVEVKEDGKTKVVVSCVYPINKICEVYIESDKIKGIRRTILSMLSDRAPENKRIASLCRMYGVPKETRHTALQADISALSKDCILCGLGVESCCKLGTGGISAVGRKKRKKISTPYDEASSDCIGCGSCAAVCPTGAIACTEENSVRAIWDKTFDLAHCKLCGKPFATKEELDFCAKRDSSETLTVCENCRRKKSSDVIAQTFGIRQSTSSP
jgi:NADH dehydrogenase/NADH:ubiquinone oxidoreductase subunit G